MGSVTDVLANLFQETGDHQQRTAFADRRLTAAPTATAPKREIAEVLSRKA